MWCLSHRTTGKSQEEVIIGTIWGKSCRVCNPSLVDWCEVTVWCSRNLSHQPSGSNHLESMSLSSTWSYHPPLGAGAFIPSDEFRDVHQVAMHILRRAARTRPHCTTLVFFLRSLTLLISNCLNLSFGRPRRLVCLLHIRKGEHRKSFVPGRSPQSLACCQASLFFDSPQSCRNRCWTRKGITFWVERLIINSAWELGFRGTRFHSLSDIFNSFPSTWKPNWCPHL